jgi:SAM-dependent methyltransferase
LEQTRPVPTLTELKELYESHYNFGGEKETCYTELRERFLFSFLYKLWLWIDGDISFHCRRGPGRLLDIGCNEGRGLRVYARNGFCAEGLELNDNAARIARDAGFCIHTNPIEHFQPSAPYDVAVLSNVLEHMLDPRTTLAHVQRITRPNGQVWMSCPNSESWLRRAMGRYWINWHVPFHTVHFSSVALRRLLEDVGFKDVQIRCATPALWVASSMITRVFSRPARSTRQLRNPLLIAFVMIIARLLLFPVLYVGNLWGKGDCLVATCTKP